MRTTIARLVSESTTPVQLSFTDADMKPGVYVGLNLMPTPAFTGALPSLRSMFAEAGIELYDPHELHCTVVYSKDASPSVEALSKAIDKDAVYAAKFAHVEMYDGHDNEGYLVLVFESPQIKALHERFKKLGCKHGFPDYKCHMTLARGFDFKTPAAKALESKLTKFLKNKALTFTFGRATYEPLGS